MILPIIGYGDPVLRKVGEAITPDYPNLKETIANMYDTMYNAYGVGLAGIGASFKLSQRFDLRIEDYALIPFQNTYTGTANVVTGGVQYNF
mgnify:CR=1 FL=1